MSGKLFKVGKVVNTHGIRGELKVVSTTDFEELRFAKGSELWLDHPSLSEPIPFKVADARAHKGTYILRFEGIQNINEVEQYKGGTLNVTEDQLAELEEDEFYYYEIVGCRVVTEEGEELGTIKEILSTGANDVWVVKGKSGKDILIPYIDEVVLEVDVEEQLVKIHLMEGLL
ncbi:ribosome maturation factor RimM [Marinicrinis lubricantis]|uniref:Ribosome maturation factor RimM n=1 Tax=Marinicrinis lubricantis TaxID=2086470 RepID=A0ABW1IMP4_9BACL